MKNGTIWCSASDRETNCRWTTIGGVAAAAMAFGGIATADFVEWQFESEVVLVDGQTFSVIDVYAQFDDPTDTVLNVFNSMIGTSTGVEFHHNDFNTLGGLAGAWNANQSGDMSGGVDARIDSFVLIGGELGGGNTTTLDPSFDPGTGGTVAVNAGWFNSNPPNLQGRVDADSVRTWVARFVIAGIDSDVALNYSANLGYNKGLGTPAQFAYDNGQGSGPMIETEFADPCEILTLDPISSASPAAGGVLSFEVLIANQQCSWTAETGVDWITLDVGSGTGDGEVLFTVAENPAAIVRTASIVVNGTAHAVEQAAAPCEVTGLDVLASEYPFEGGSGAFTVSTNGPDCAWNAFSSAAWVTITEGASGTGESGLVSYTVSANPNAFKRTAVVVVGTEAHTILQSPAPCAVTGLDADSATFGSAGGGGTITVSTNGGVCSWQATSSASWITITEGADGTGSSGEIVYLVDANPAAAGRTAEIAVGGFIHTVTQDAAPCAVVGISSDSTAIAFEGGSSSFEVTTNGEVCEWSATSSAEWIVLETASGGGVTSTLSFTVAENVLAEARSGEISVGGFVHTVSQDAAPCAVTAAIPSEVAALPGEASYSVAITTNGEACTWSANTAEEWIVLDTASGTGNGGIEFTVAANPVTLERVGSIEIEGVVVTVVQAALPCAIVAVDPAEATFDFLGGDLAIDVSTNGDNCDWTASTDADWLSIVEGGSGTGSSGTISVEVAIYDGVESRMATITVGSQTALITQTGGLDCNADGLGDAFEILEGLVPDCNANGVPDSCDIADGSSADLNGNGIPDECEQDLVVSVPGDYATIQDAIDGSLDGWTIQVAPGVYNEQIALGNRQIVVEALAGLGETVLDGDGLPGSVVTMIAPEGNTDPGPTFRGFTVTGGQGGSPIGTTPNFGGGGLYLEYSNATVEQCRVIDNSAPLAGGLYSFYGAPTVSNSQIVSNTATAGDGGGIQVFRAAATIVGCTLDGNFAVGLGGGIHVPRGESSIIDCIVVNNEALGTGGGVSYFAVEESSLLLSGTVIEGNLTSSAGGGLWVRPGFDNVLIENSVICDNSPDEISGEFTDLGGNDLCICPADLTGNGSVNGADLAELLALWGPCDGGACSEADFNDDGNVDGADLSVMLGSWGVCR